MYRENIEQVKTRKVAGVKKRESTALFGGLHCGKAIEYMKAIEHSLQSAEAVYNGSNCFTSLVLFVYNIKILC